MNDSENNETKWRNILRRIQYLQKEHPDECGKVFVNVVQEIVDKKQSADFLEAALLSELDRMDDEISKD